MHLKRDMLGNLPKTVKWSPYGESATQVGVVHLGVGQFHRSHQAMYVDRFLTKHPDAPWAICGVGVRSEDRAIAAGLRAQEGLFSLSLFHPDGTVSTSIVSSISEYLFHPEEPDVVLERMMNPETKIVSLTVTESGYPEDRFNGRVVGDDAELMADVTAGLSRPKTAFGLLVAALQGRRQRGIPAFTVVSCDNIEHNGQVTCESVLAVAKLVDTELETWIAGNVAFPSTMVDRITPRPTPEQVTRITETLGFEDEVPVVAEPFVQWVIEDRFPTGRPSLEEVGVTFVESVESFETMKLRLLNGAHQLLAYLGLVAGHRYAHDAIADPAIARLVERYWLELALPTLLLPAGVDGIAYIEALRERFSNHAIADTLERLGTDSISRMAKFVLPTLVESRQQPSFLEIVPQVLAAWFEVIRTTSSDNVLSDMPRDLLERIRGTGRPSETLRAATWFEPLSDDEELLGAVDAAHAWLTE